MGIHETFDQRSAEHVLQDSNIGVLFLTSKQLMSQPSTKRWNGKCGTMNVSPLKHLVLVDEMTVEIEKDEWVKKRRHVSIWTLEDFMNMEDNVKEEVGEEEHTNEELTVLYTSGSSGLPKGVVVTSKTFLSDISQAIYTIPLVTCSYIPLSHSSDRMKLWNFLANGGRVGFVTYDPDNWNEHENSKKSGLVGNFVRHERSSPDIVSLFHQIQDLCPSAMSCPPRIWNGLYNLYLNKIREGLEEREALKYVASMFGTRIQHLATGGGMTSSVVMDFARRLAILCEAHFVESYGTTEVGAIAENSKPRSNVSVRLRQVVGNIGELEVKTPTMSSGYLNNQKATREAFLPDGYFRTGDLVRLHSKSKRITILGRCSASVVTKSGHVVFPSRLESCYETRSVLIDRIVVLARNDFDAIVAVVVPETTMKDEKCILKEMTRIGHELKLNDIEIPQRIHVSSTKWTVSNGLLAGNTKIMRKALRSHYSGEIERMWKSLSSSSV